MCFDEDVAAVQVPAVSLGPEKDGEEQARRLFDALRTIDQLGARSRLCPLPEADRRGACRL